jgi:hypothetical protein
MAGTVQIRWRRLTTPWIESPQSTTVSRFRYQAPRLDIQFTSGAPYQYLAVPEPVFAGLCRAESKGRFFNRHILKKFDFIRPPGIQL